MFKKFVLKYFDQRKITYRFVVENFNYFMALVFAFVMPLNKKMLPWIIGLWMLSWVLEGRFITKFRNFRKNKMLFVAALIFYGTHLLGLLYSENIRFAVFDVQVKLTLLFAPLILAGSNRIYKTRTNEILLSFVLGNLVAALLCFFIAFKNSILFIDGHLVFDPMIDPFLNRFYYVSFSAFHHASYFAMYLTFSLAIITYFFLRNIYVKNSVWKVVFIISSLIFLITIYFLSSKAGLITSFFIVFISLILLINHFVKKNAVLIISSLIIAISISGYYLLKYNGRLNQLMEQISHNQTNLNSQNMRVSVWMGAFHVIEENFVFGVGSGDIKAKLYEKYDQIGFKEGIKRHYNAHQQFLETTIGYGVFGLFLLLFLLVIPFYKSIEEKNYLWFSLIFIVFVNFMFESMLNTIAGVSFFALFYSLLAYVPYENMRQKIPFSPPHIDDKIIHEVIDTLHSGWITTGPKTKLFEKKIEQYCGCDKCLCVNSATAGLKLILRWYGVGPGDEVIVPAYTYSATANVVIHSGARLVLVDVNTHDFNISLSEIEKAITEKTKVIIPVDFAGYPCDYDEINALVRSEKIKQLFKPANNVQRKLGRILILSDSAHSLGAEYKGKKTGSLTDISVFSFHAVKNLTTGEGGAIAFNFKDEFNDYDLYHQLNILSLHGQTKDAFQKNSDGNWKYDIIDAGYKSNMTDILASMGLVEMDRYEKDSLRKFKYIFDLYSNAFKDKKWAIIPLYETDIKKSSYHIYTLRIKDISESERDDIMKRIFKRNVSVNVHFMPIPMFSFYKGLDYKIEKYPKAYANYSAEITLPVFYDLTENQVYKVIDAVIKSVEEVIERK